MVNITLSYGMILAPTVRSSMYLQMCKFANVKISNVVLLDGSKQVCNLKDITHIGLGWGEGEFCFDHEVDIDSLLNEMNVEYSYAPCSDVNSPDFIKYLSSLPDMDYIYSGKPGVILGGDLLSRAGKRFLHAHGGRAPRYSGSTAFYYSILEKGMIAATVFWMDRGIDTGEIVAIVEREPYEGLNIDFVQDPLLRAEALISALSKLEDKEGDEMPLESCNEERVTYHVIHPILKNCAVRKVKKLEKRHASNGNH